MLLTDTAAVVDAGYPDNRQLVISDLGELVLKKFVRHELSPAAKVLLAETLLLSSISKVCG